MKSEFCSDNSVSLPGMASGTSGPTGFEPGMFISAKTDEESTAKVKVEKDKEKSADGQSKVRTFNSAQILEKINNNLKINFLL